jgi:HEAT repeat protein
MMAAPTGAQSGEELVRQLCGKADAPARNAGQLAQAYQGALDYLLPLMSAEDVGSRYAPQILLQDMGSHASRPGAEAEREVLARVLIKNADQPNLPDTVRHWIVLQIERIGKGECVPGLAKLMTAQDGHLRDYARRALEKNPDPSATDALVKALAEATDPQWKIGLINALGSRGDEAAVRPLADMLRDAHSRVAASAVTALSNIASEESGTALFSVFETPLSPLHMKAAQGLIDIAQELTRHNDLATATLIYEALYGGATELSQESDEVNPFNIRAAAIVGLITCDPEKAIEQIAEPMQDKDPKVRAAVVQGARQARSKAPLHVLTALLPTLDPQSQVQVLGLIGDRGDLSSIEPVKKALGSNEESVRLAAIEALTKVGADDGAEALFEIAVAGSGAGQKAARDGLAVMAGPRVEEIVAARAASGDGNARAVAIGLLGKRRAPGTAQTLLDYAADGDAEISRAAFGAMVDVAGTIDVATLADLVAKTKAGPARDAGITALRAALANAADENAAAEAVIGRMETADAGARIAMLGCLDAGGGPAALAAVCEAAQSPDETLRDAAIRTLGNWPDFEGAEMLVGIASKPQTSLTHYVLAVRGALRLIAAGESAPMEERVALCLATMDHARRDDEKRQAITTLGALPCQEAIDRLMELIEGETLKTEAALAAVDLAGRMAATDRQAARDVAQKIRDMNLSDEVNRRADAVLSGRWRGRWR